MRFSFFRFAHALSLCISNALRLSSQGVCIRGGSKDLADHLRGVTMRPKVVLQLISYLRESGYLGYEFDGVNSQAKLEARMDKLYVHKYGSAEFIP